MEKVTQNDLIHGLVSAALQSHASQFRMSAIVAMSLLPLRRISIAFCSNCTKDGACSFKFVIAVSKFGSSTP